MINGMHVKVVIRNKWPKVHWFHVSDSEYEPINDDDIAKYWHRWKYGFLGFGGAPIYETESQDCDDLVRDFIVRFRRKHKIKDVGRAIFYTAWNGHAYVSYVNQDLQVKSIDLNDGKLHEIESFVVEML